MPNLNDVIFNKIKLGNIWFFITEKCNLNCDYCFFSDRKDKNTLTFNQILSLLERLPQNKKYDFIISGGEPLLCWGLVRKLIEYIRERHFQSEITLQTNMFFLSENKVKLLKEEDVVIEPGIDGDFLSNFRHRKGFTRVNFKKCLKNLNSVIKNNLRMNPTMTVHPQEVKSMFENFTKLVSLGLNSIEVHPAFLADWERKYIKEFIIQYKRIIDYEKGLGRYLVCKSYSSFINSSLDLVIQPDGFVLPNWIFLSFPYNLRKNFFIIKLLKNNIVILKKNLQNYLYYLGIFFKKRRTYRDFSNFNASLILKYIKSKNLKEDFLVYESLCNRIQQIDRIFLKKEDMLT